MGEVITSARCPLVSVVLETSVCQHLKYQTLDYATDKNVRRLGTVTEATIHDFYAVQDGQQRRRSSAAASSASSSPSRRFLATMKSLLRRSSQPKDIEKRSQRWNREDEG